MTTSPDDRMAWAEVRARDCVILYRRAGVPGRPVVVLGDAPDAGAGLLAAVAARYRLLLPDLGSVPGDIAQMLSCFLEGLGAPAAFVMATSPFCAAALELAALDTAAVAGIVVIGKGNDRSFAEAGLVVPDGPAPIPLLLVRGGQPADSMTARILAFLETGA